MGTLCRHIQAGSDGPRKLPVSRKSRICERCEERGLHPDHGRLLEAARVLFEHKVRDERVIIPTLVFASASDHNDDYRRMGERVVQSYGDAGAWAWVLEDFFYTSDPFKPVVPVGGVPIYRRSPVSVEYMRSTDRKIVTGIALRVYERSNLKDEQRQIRERYELALKARKIPQAAGRGSIGWDKAEGSLTLLVGTGAAPELSPLRRAEDFPTITSRGVKRTQPTFPPAAAVTQMYTALRASGQGPDGREGGGSHNPRRLVPAVVAWYMGGRNQVLENAGAKAAATKLVTRHLLKPHGITAAPKDLSRVLERALPFIKDVEEAIRLNRRQVHINF